MLFSYFYHLFVVMPATCVAGFCSNRRGDGFSLFKFPKEEKIRKQWTLQVQRTRESWQPTDNSVLCSAHFEESCFEQRPLLKESLGFSVQQKLRLRPEAIPTIFKRPRHVSPPKRSSQAVRKRQRLEVSVSACRILQCRQS